VGGGGVGTSGGAGGTVGTDGGGAGSAAGIALIVAKAVASLIV
jgi:hypothetical protein